MNRRDRIDFYRKQVAAQRQWINEHGGNEAGYVELYGAASDPNKYGDGGEAIFKADSDALVKYEQQLAALLEQDRGSR